MNSCDCLHPVTIVNPKWRIFALRCNCLQLRNDMIYYSSENRGNILSGDGIFDVFKRFLPTSFKNFTSDDCEEYSFINTDTGESYPVYIQVPCGKCDLCQSKKIAGYVQRCQFALEESRLPGYYVTLTYNDGHLPLTGLNKRDLQLWKKRVRKTVETLYGSSVELKFFSVGEYGHDSDRPHFHNLCFGMPVFFSQPEKQRYIVNKIFQYCWRDNVYVNRVVESSSPHYLFDYRVNGSLSVPKSLSLLKLDKHSRYQSFEDYCSQFPKAFKQPAGYDPFSYGFVNCVDMYSDGVASYVTKYCLKYSTEDFKEDFEKIKSRHPFYSLPFSPISSHHLGVNFVNSLIKKDSVKPFQFSTIYTGKYKEVNLCRYYLDKVFPSWCSLIPVEVRRAYFDGLYTAYYLMNYNYRIRKVVNRDLLFFVDRMNSHLPFMDLLDCSFDSNFLSTFVDYRDYKSLLSDFLECYCKVMEFEFDVAEFERQMIQRDKYFSRFQSFDFYNRVKEFKSNQAKLATKLKLL